MGKYMKKCQVGEIRVVELAAKRMREVGDGDFDRASAYVGPRSTRRRVVVAEMSSISPADGSVRCGPMNPAEVANCAVVDSYNTSIELVDDQPTIFESAAEIKRAQLQILTFSGGRERSYTSQSSESRVEEAKVMEPTASRPRTEANSRRGAMAHEMPSESEIEEFFAAAEKDLQTSFAEKYNFDIVKGVPLEGCYEWIPANGHERS